MALYLPYPSLQKEGSEKPQKLPTRFGEEPFKISASIYFGFGRVEIFKSQKDGLIAEMDTRLADSGQGMLFIKWI